MTRISKTRKAVPVELGCAGHFIGANSCAWRRHTQVGNYRISSVGEYYPHGAVERCTIGAGKDAFFETFVFRTEACDAENAEECGCRMVTNWTEIEGIRYATAGQAQKGHEAMVQKYVKARKGETE